ncbi:uncharacterized protein LOC116176947 isoform X2 [Photinus pyralis]|nr:uncharacterized protein LOC116176947 isoform X2 [Photinus pyralis]
MKRSKTDNKISKQTDKLFWYHTLVDLQKRGMDKVALAASGPICKLCYIKVPQCPLHVKENQLNSEEYNEIVKLNSWRSKSIPKNQVKRSIGDMDRTMSLPRETSQELLLRGSKSCTSNKEDLPDTTQERETEQKNMDISIPPISEVTTTSSKGSISLLTTTDNGQIRGTSRELKGEEQIHDDSPLYRESQDIPQRETAHVEKAEEEFQGDIAIVENQQQPKDASSDYGLCSGSKSQSCQMEPLLDLSPIEQCPICSYEHCVCRERLDEQTKEFMEELQNRLHKTDQPEDKPNDTEKSAAICCEFCDDPHICSLMSKDLTGDTKLPSTMEDDYLKIIFKLNSLTQSLSDVIPVETEKETKDNSGQKVKKVTYVKAEDSNLFDPAESTIITPKASRSVSIVGVERYVESDDSLIIYVEPLSWYASESTK